MLSSRLESLVACRNCWTPLLVLLVKCTDKNKNKALSPNLICHSVLLYSFETGALDGAGLKFLHLLCQPLQGWDSRQELHPVTSESSQRTSHPHENMGCEESPDSEEMVVYQLWDPPVRGPESGLHGWGLLSPCWISQTSSSTASAVSRQLF